MALENCDIKFFLYRKITGSIRVISATFRLSLIGVIGCMSFNCCWSNVSTKFSFYSINQGVYKVFTIQIERHHKIWTIRYSPYRRCTRSNTDLLFIRQEIVTKKLAKSKNLLLNISKILTANDAMTS